MLRSFQDIDMQCCPSVRLARGAAPMRTRAAAVDAGRTRTPVAPHADARAARRRPARIIAQMHQAAHLHAAQTPVRISYSSTL